MVDLTKFFITCREVYKEKNDRFMKERKYHILEYVLNTKENFKCCLCLSVLEENDNLCYSCLQTLHVDKRYTIPVIADDILRINFFIEVLEEYKNIKKSRKKNISEFIYFHISKYIDNSTIKNIYSIQKLNSTKDLHKYLSENDFKKNKEEDICKFLFRNNVELKLLLKKAGLSEKENPLEEFVLLKNLCSLIKKKVIKNYFIINVIKKIKVLEEVLENLTIEQKIYKSTGRHSENIKENIQEIRKEIYVQFVKIYELVE